MSNLRNGPDKHDYLISFKLPTNTALLTMVDALYTAALERNKETSFLAVLNSSNRLSTLVVTSSAFTFMRKKLLGLVGPDVPLEKSYNFTENKKDLTFLTG